MDFITVFLISILSFFVGGVFVYWLILWLFSRNNWRG